MAQEVSIITAFTAGFLSFLAPCILPLIPPYFAWLLGISKGDFQKRDVKIKMFFHSLLLVLGFAAIFIVLGAGASALGNFLAPYRLLIQKIGGLVIIFFGLEFAGFLKIFKNYKIDLVKRLFSKINNKTNSFLIGLIFAFAWVVCFSPILGSIFVLASLKGTLDKGVILLGFYSLGLSVPFLLSSFFLGFLMDKINLFSKISRWINLFSGSTLIIFGALLLTDKFYKIVAWLYKLI